MIIDIFFTTLPDGRRAMVVAQAAIIDGLPVIVLDIITAERER